MAVVRAGLALALGLALAASTVVARAQLAGPTLGRVRAMLEDYDPGGPRALEALRELHAIIRVGSPRDPSIREARFLRAALATDLLLVGALDAARAPAPDDVARAISVAPGDLVAHLREELTFVRRGPFMAPCDEAIAALDAVSDAEHAHLRPATGARRDVLRALAVAAALEVAADPLDALSPLADDPCREGCDPTYAWLDERGRRAAHALAMAEDAFGRLDGVERDDPFVHAVRPAIDEAEARLASAVLAPLPVLPAELAGSGDDAGELLRPDVVISVGADALRVGWVPVLRVSEHRIEVSSSGPGILEPARIALPSTYRPIVQSVAEIAALGASLSSSGRTPLVALTVTDAPAHVVVRTLVSLAAAGVENVRLARRDASGYVRGVVVRVLEPSELDALAGNLHVTVRPAGLEVQRSGGREVRIDRERGAPSHDLEALAAIAARMAHRSTSVEAWHSVPGADFVDVAFRVAGPDGVAVLRR